MYQSKLVFKMIVCKLFLCFLVFFVSAECKRFSSGWGRSKPSYSSRPAVHHPSSFSHPSHYAPSAPKVTRPIGFQIPQSGHSSATSSHSNPPNFGFNTKPNPPNTRLSPQPVHSSNVKPSAPPAEHASVHTTKPLGSGNPGSVATNHQSHSITPPPYGVKPSAPLAEQKPLGNNPGSLATNHQSHSNNPPPYGVKPSAPLAEQKPLGSGNPGSSATHSNTPPPYGFKPINAPVGPPVNSKPVGNAPPGAPYPIQPPPYTPHNPGVPPPAYHPSHNPAGYGPPPAYNPAGYGASPAYNYHPYQNYPQHGGVTNININNINTNTHHYGGTGGWGGYSYPSYHYSSNEVGSGTLGFFLGYSLAKITTPTFYSHPTFYNGYTPRYDHYEVHHYYHNRDSVPAQSTIQPNTIVGCVGDSGAICPSGTTSLCTSNGAILCVASATSTVPCTGNSQANCVKSTVPCVNGTGDCQVGQNTTLTIPCISKAQVPGNITYVNNTIIVNQTTIINNANGTVVQPNLISNGTVPSLGNLTAITQISNSTTRSRREVPMNEFCVTILAVPAERKPSEQQQLLDKSTGIFSKFLVKALGIQ